jgi:hypothetical protein
MAFLLLLIHFALANGYATSSLLCVQAKTEGVIRLFWWILYV